MEQKNHNGRGIFYGVIGVATLVVAIVGATFAYFTANRSAGQNVITGNMATITFSLNVEKMTDVDETHGGMIPMSNSMVEIAATGTNNEACLDNNGNAVCQIYKITLENTGSASLFLDGYVSIVGGSGTSNDYVRPQNDTSVDSTMRWVQLFCTETAGEISGCTTAGATTTGATGINAFTSLNSTTDPMNKANIKTAYADVVSTGTISGNSYAVIGRNYIRVNKRAEGATGFTREGDVASALVYNQYLNPTGSVSGSQVVYYILVWLTENGTNQTAGEEGNFTNADGLNFFNGLVSFTSAQGGEVTATFTGYTVATTSDAASASNGG